jgi:hypothetical protein
VLLKLNKDEEFPTTNKPDVEWVLKKVEATEN